MWCWRRRRRCLGRRYWPGRFNDAPCRRLRLLLTRNIPPRFLRLGFRCWRVGCTRNTRHHTDVLLDDYVGRSANENQMFDIVAPHQNKTAATVDGRCIHHSKAGPAVAAAEDKRASSKATQCADDDQKNEKQQQRQRDPQDGVGIAFGQIISKPLQHCNLPILSPRTLDMWTNRPQPRCSPEKCVDQQRKAFPHWQEYDSSGSNRPVAATG